MSDIFRASVLSRLPPPTRAPWAADINGDGDGDDDDDMLEELDDDFEEEEDGLGELPSLGRPSSSSSSLNNGGSSASAASSSAKPGPSSSRASRGKKPRNAFGIDLSPISPSSYFSQALEVSPPESVLTFRAYYSPPTVARGDNVKDGSTGNGNRNNNGSVLVCHHGAGSSGTTFALLAKGITDKSRGTLGLLTFDARGHGKTRLREDVSGATTKKVSSDVELELSFDNLQNDFISFLSEVFPSPSEAPDFLLLGHSMGASPIVSSSSRLQAKGYTVSGVIILDVVEGTAVESLPLMKSILAQRPSNFKSIQEAIEWHLSSGAVRNPESARVSVPALFVPEPNKPGVGAHADQNQNQIQTQDQDQDQGQAQGVVWRTDLMATSMYWEGWYINLSSHFLAARGAKLLVLAGQERLDKELMVGQM